MLFHRNQDRETARSIPRDLEGRVHEMVNSQAGLTRGLQGGWTGEPQPAIGGPPGCRRGDDRLASEPAPQYFL